MGIVALCLNAIKAISDSPKVENYNVGFTAQPLLKRGAQYRGIGYSSLVLLADRLTRGEALQLEETLWYAIRAYDKRSNVYTNLWPTQTVGDTAPATVGHHRNGRPIAFTASMLHGRRTPNCSKPLGAFFPIIVSA